MNRLMIVDDHSLVRETIAAFIEHSGDFDLTLAEDLESACEQIDRTGMFDLILLDYQMPGMSGLHGLKRALGCNGGKSVALMSGVASKEIVQKAIEMGACGFIPKTMPAKSLVNAIRFMGMGETYIPFGFMTSTPMERPVHPIAASLTSREMQVLSKLCEGSENSHIAQALGIKVVTVKLHVASICRKLEANNRTQAALTAKHLGVL